MLEILKAILFGIVEGITEWLPISSTGHMILLNEIMPLKVSDAFYSMFEVVIQLGAIMAFNRAYDILEPQKHDEVITFESAVDALSNEMSGVVQLTVNRAEFVYVPKHIEESDNRLDVSACWKFMARNSNDQLNYVIYINAVTGSCEYYKYD